MHDYFISDSRSRSWSRRSRSCDKWPHARSVGSDRVKGIVWGFSFYESTRFHSERHGAGIFHFILGVRSRDPEFSIIGQIDERLSMMFSDMD